MATSHHIMCGECEAVQEADGQPIAKLTAAVRDVGPVLDHTATKGRRKGGTSGGGGNRGARAMVTHAERALGHAPGAKAGPYAAEAMRRLVAGDLPPPASSEAGTAATKRVVRAILRVQRAAAQVRKAWRQASATETARRAEEEAHHIWVGITWGVWARNPDMRVNTEGEPTDAALEAAVHRVERQAADAAADAKRRRLQPEHSKRTRRRTAGARSTTGGTEKKGWSVTRALAEWKYRQLKGQIGELEESAGKGEGTEAEQRAKQDMTRRVRAYEKGTAQDEGGDTTKKGEGEGEAGSGGAGKDGGGKGGDEGKEGRGGNGGGRGASGSGSGESGSGARGDDSGHEGGGEGDGEGESSGGEDGGGENERGGGERGGGDDDDGDGHMPEGEDSSGGGERSAQTATVKVHTTHAHAHGGKRDAVRETGNADSEAPSGKRRKAHAETAKATNDGGAESREETGRGRGGGGGSGSGEGGSGASDDSSGRASGGEGGVEDGGSGSEDGGRKGERGGGESGGGGEDNGDRSENEGEGGRRGGERGAPAAIGKVNRSGRRRSRATEMEGEATHVANTEATGKLGGSSHEAKRRRAATTSAMKATTSDAEAMAARRADATNKRKERSRDEIDASDGGARNTRDTRVQKHCQRHAKHGRKSEEASGRPKATSTQDRAHAAARERDKARQGTDGEDEWDSADEALSSDAARARRPGTLRTHHIDQIQKIPSAVVNSQKLLDTAPEREENTQDVSTHIQTASSPIATVLARARGQKRVANYDEIGHRTGPRKKRTLYIADVKQATGQLVTEIQIGQRMLGIIESSARYAQAMEAAARQRQQTYDDG